MQNVSDIVKDDPSVYNSRLLKGISAGLLSTFYNVWMHIEVVYTTMHSKTTHKHLRILGKRENMYKEYIKNLAFSTKSQ